MWVEKYKPTTLDQIVGNNHAVAKVKNWIRNFPGKESRTGERLIADRVLLLSGPEGCGKTLLANLLLNDYKVFSFSLRDIRNHKKDRELLNNFCELYRVNVKHLGSPHAIILDDFDSLSDSKIDKAVHTTLVNLVETPLRGKPPPLILTMTTMSDVSTKKRNSRYQGIANLAYDIQLSPVRIPDLEDYLGIIAKREHVKCEPKVIPLIADYSNGDVRKCVQTFEMISKSAQNITNEKALEWIDQNTNDTDEKYLFQNDPGAKFNQTDDDRILQSALCRKTDRRSVKIMQTARRIVSSNSAQLTPLLYQAYPMLLAEKADTLERIAEISEIFSLADMIREQSFGHCNGSLIGLEDDSGATHYTTIVSTLSVDLPLNILRQHMKDNSIVTSAGYQTFYGVGNTSLNQHKLVRSLNELSPNMSSARKEDFFFLQTILSDKLANPSYDNDEIVEMLYTCGLHPNNLEMLSKLKGNNGITLSVPRSRKKKLIELYQGLEEEQDTVSVKFLDDEATSKKQSITSKFLKKHLVEEEEEDKSTDSVFTMVW